MGTLATGDIVNIIGDSFFKPDTQYEVCGMEGDEWYDNCGFIHPHLGVTVVAVGEPRERGIWVFKDKVRLVLPKEPTWEL